MLLSLPDKCYENYVVYASLNRKSGVRSQESGVSASAALRVICYGARLWEP